MAAVFTPITIDEMTEFLGEQGFETIALPNCEEIVFAKIMKHEDLKLSLRIYTAIGKNGQSREKGSDAIRVSLFIKLKDGTIMMLGGDKIVKRTQNWRKNLAERIGNWRENLPVCPCDKCGLPMVRKQGQFGEFVGCIDFPVCDGKLKKNYEPDRLKNV